MLIIVNSPFTYLHDFLQVFIHVRNHVMPIRDPFLFSENGPDPMILLLRVSFAETIGDFKQSVNNAGKNSPFFPFL
jgi:hypothetical protein